jgi:hypothetical protein
MQGQLKMLRECFKREISSHALDSFPAIAGFSLVSSRSHNNAFLSVVRKFETVGSLKQVSVWVHLLVDIMRQACGFVSADVGWSLSVCFWGGCRPAAIMFQLISSNDRNWVVSGRAAFGK